MTKIALDRPQKSGMVTFSQNRVGSFCTGKKGTTPKVIKNCQIKKVKRVMVIFSGK